MWLGYETSQTHASSKLFLQPTHIHMYYRKGHSGPNFMGHSGLCVLGYLDLHSVIQTVCEAISFEFVIKDLERMFGLICDHDLYGCL